MLLANQQAEFFAFIITIENNSSHNSAKGIFIWVSFQVIGFLNPAPLSLYHAQILKVPYIGTKKNLTNALNRWHICTQSWMIGCWYNRWNGTASVSSAPSSKNTPAKRSWGEKRTKSRVDSDNTNFLLHNRQRHLQFTRINGPSNKTSLIKGLFSLSVHP